MKNKITSLFFLFICLSFINKVDAQSTATVIKIEADKVIGKVNPNFYGLMTEEINFSYDGGLYAELIRNRAFKDHKDTAVHWSLVQEDGAFTKMALDSVSQPGTALNRNLRVEFSSNGKGKSGIANDGFWGIPVKGVTNYQASFYAKAQKGFIAPLTVAIESNDGKIIFANAQVKNISTGWKKYSVVLSTIDTTPSLNNRFTITTKGKGKVWFSLVSLFPPTFNNRPNGNRIDMMKLLAEMKPAFLRFPGGNYLQSKTLQNRFDWKKTIGDISQRPTHDNDSWRYHSSDGMGLLEFLEWCEDLKMQPLLAVFAGFTLGSPNPIVGDSLQPYVKDALDEIEYVTGDSTTKWGKQRAKDGHPQPFTLNMVEVGNEDYFDRKKTSDVRFTPFYDAIKAKYPNIQVISSAPVSTRTPDLEDIHHYFPFKKALQLAHQYDNYNRAKPKVFIGEYACREGAPSTNLKGALGDAAFLTGLERNADIVKMSCYAPLFVNVNPGAMQWKSDLIGYDGLVSYGSPSFYVQKVFNENLGDELVQSSIANVPMAADTTEQIFYSVTKDNNKNALFVKMVNVSDAAKQVVFDINSIKSIAAEGFATIITSAKTDDTNSVTTPKKIIPDTVKALGLAKQFTYDLKPNSVTVLQLNLN